MSESTSRPATGVHEKLVTQSGLRIRLGTEAPEDRDVHVDILGNAFSSLEFRVGTAEKGTETTFKREFEQRLSSHRIFHSCSLRRMSTKAASNSAAMGLVNFQTVSANVYKLQPAAGENVTASNHKHDPTLIIIFGWMSAQLPHLLKYTREYERLYPHATQIVVRCEPSFFFKGKTAQEAQAKPLVDCLEQIGYLEPKGKPLDTPAAPVQRPRILVHAFSNGGASQAVLLSDVLKTRTLAAMASSMRSIPSALILDSTPGNSELSNTITAFTIQIRNPLLRYPAMLLMAVGFAFTFVYTAFSGKEHPIDMLRRRLLDPALFPWSHSDMPRLYVYSKHDRLVPCNSVRAHVREAKSKGFEVEVEEFGESAHVAHARTDPERYWTAVKGVWERAVVVAGV
ncbi:hypothetical protein EVG20_g569 [Dentipellis fragilis]|uniref:DUF829-domain-containing protein n=1 Tax=Dentipellis fragilis TaxID=205917 RepID=A0A4Y9ZE92_9AGAM|nr:hypothetical protein EVG20_g569 [Dentipellis fragilis]